MNPIHAIALANFICCLDTSILNVSLPALSESFRAGLIDLEKVISWHTLALGLALIPSGLIADRVGRKKVFVSGMVLFIFSSILCALSTELMSFSWARVVQGIASAMMIANSNALISQVATKDQLGKALGTGAMFVAAGYLLGPILGGVLLSFMHWSGLFWINVPVGVIALACVVGQVPNQEPAPTVAPVKKSEWSAGFFVGLILAFLVFTAFSGMFLSIPFYLTQELGLSSGETGLVLAGMPLMMIIFSPRIGKWSDQVGARPPILIGLGVLFCAIGLASLMMFDSALKWIGFAIPLILGLAIAFFQVPNNSRTLQQTPTEFLSLGSASVSVVRNLGYTLGTMLTPRLASHVGVGKSTLLLCLLPIAAILCQHLEDERDGKNRKI